MTIGRVGNRTPTNLEKNRILLIGISIERNQTNKTHRNDANSIGLTSTIPLTITEHNEKNSDDSVASIIPKYGQLHLKRKYFVKF